MFWEYYLLYNNRLRLATTTTNFAERTNQRKQGNTCRERERREGETFELEGASILELGASTNK